MRALGANLKTLYQCPAIWFWHLIGFIVFVDGVLTPVLEPVAGQGEFMKFLILPFWIGMVTASMMKETLGKPLTFCLPGHQRIVRRVIFTVGGAQAVLFSLMALAYPGLDAVERLSGMVSVACLAMTVYLLSVTCMFRLRNASAFWGVPVLFLTLFQSVFTGLRETIEAAAIFHPVANAAVLAPVAVLIWLRAGHRGVARRQSGSTFMPLQYLWNRPALERYGKERRIHQLDRQSTGLWRRIEGRFLARMRRLPAYSGGRHAAGSRYVLFGGTLPLSPTLALGIMLAVVVLVAVLGFATPAERHEGFSKANFLYLIPCIVGLTVALPLYSTLLVPAGRRERYRTCLVIGTRGALLVLLLSAALYAVSFAIGAAIPEVTWSGRTFTYRPMEPELVLYPLVVLPLLYACQIGFPRRPQIPQTVILIGAAFVAVPFPGSFLQAVSVVGLVIVAIPCWWCFVGPLHHRCFHGDLALG